MLGIVLSKQAHKEHDQIVNIFTQSKGRNSYLAKGSKKINSKNAYYLEPFSCVDFGAARSSSMDRITSVDSVKFFSRTRRNLTKSLVANYVCKIVNKSTRKKQKNESIFNLLLQWLIFLEGVNQVNSFVIDSLILQLFSHLGFRPNLKTDNINGTVAFSIKRGGFINLSNTRMSEETFTCSKKEIKLLQKMLSFDFSSDNFPKRVDNKTSKKLHNILFKFLAYHNEHKIPDWHKVLPKL